MSLPPECTDATCVPVTGDEMLGRRSAQFPGRIRPAEEAERSGHTVTVDAKAVGERAGWTYRGHPRM
jgi:hypothetical protein